jgi:hypothetical protein
MFCMKRGLLMICFLLIFLFNGFSVKAQCSICTRTASQLGHKPAQALNAGILYLAAAPLLLAGFIGYKWLKNNGGE